MKLRGLNLRPRSKSLQKLPQKKRGTSSPIDGPGSFNQPDSNIHIFPFHYIESRHLLSHE